MGSLMTTNMAVKQSHPEINSTYSLNTVGMQKILFLTKLKNFRIGMHAAFLLLCNAGSVVIKPRDRPSLKTFDGFT